MTDSPKIRGLHARLLETDEATERLEEDRVLQLLVVYKHPMDYPQHHVARIQEVRPDKTVRSHALPWAVGSLEYVRSKIPASMSLIGRERDDDPAILEVWL